MKKVVFFIFTIIINIVFVEYVFAAEEYLVKIRDYPASFYSSAGSGYITSLDAGTVYSLESLTKVGNYYKISTEEEGIGYVKATSVIAYIDMDSDLEESTLACIAELEEEGFEDSGYIPYLCFLQLQYPDWNFTAVDTGLDWDDAVTSESTCQKSYINLYDSIYDYYAADYENTECNNIYSSDWYPATYEAVSYHMDPRNFLSAEYIFQFEDLTYNFDISVSSYESAIYSIIKGANFYTYSSDLEDVIAASGKETGVNPTFLASRIYIELGSGSTYSGMYSGTYTKNNVDYSGYYNFINWSVTDLCATTSGSVVCALTYAKSVGWTSPTLAIEGGATLIKTNYIDVGQNTTYFQKFNVSPTKSSNLYTHQYQTNIEAPSTEAYKTFSGYNSAGKLSNAFEFLIPVYKNMPDVIESDYDSESPNEDGYSSSSIKSIVTDSGYTYDSSYISSFAVGDSVSSIISALEKEAGSGNVVIYDSSSKEITSGIIKTGYTVKITNSSGTTSLTAVVYGDTSGDGEITALDLLQVQKNLVGLYTLSGAYEEAADTSKDDSVTALDLLQIQKNIVELYTIEQ